MADVKLKNLNLPGSDLDFIIRETASEFGNKEKLKQLIREDKDFRRALIGDERVFRRVMADQEIFLRISPTLFFEVLLRKTMKELEKTSHTVERVGGEQVPVFDTGAVVSLLANEAMLEYLADMLSSFTKTESYLIPVRVRKGIWRKIRFSDMDIDSLIRLCRAMDEEHRFSFYKRIADVCLFIPAMFPEYVTMDYHYPSGDEARRRSFDRVGRSAEDYEEEGRRFYKLAREHRDAALLDLSDVLQQIHEKFNLAKKPINYISEHFVQFRKEKLFPYLRAK